MMKPNVTIKVTMPIIKNEVCNEQEGTAEHLIECKMLTIDKEITVNDIKTANKDIVSTIKKNIKQR